MIPRRTFYALASASAVLVGVWALVRMGAPGWFGLTLVFVTVGVTIAFLWPALVAGAVGFVAVKVYLWNLRRRARRSFPR